VEIAPDDHELNYDEQHMASGTVDQLRQVNSVFNERHVISESQVLNHLYHRYFIFAITGTSYAASQLHTRGGQKFLSLAILHYTFAFWWKNVTGLRYQVWSVLSEN